MKILRVLSIMHTAVRKVSGASRCYCTTKVTSANGSQLVVGPRPHATLALGSAVRFAHLDVHIASDTCAMIHSLAFCT